MGYCNRIVDCLFWADAAGVVEEVLFRAYPIERLGPILGSTWLAGAIALVFFVWNHVGAWSLRHLASVTAGGAVLTSAYIISRDLMACMAAHVAVDSVGFLVMPMIIARRRYATPAKDAGR
jgi:membrane protease YdiL (CAAX protease family)